MTWEQIFGSRQWGGCAISLDGQTIIAADYAGGACLWETTDGGANWNAVLTQTRICAVAISDDGEIIAIGSENSNYLYISVDGGANWNVRKPASLMCQSIDMNNDGSIIVAFMTGGAGWGIYRTDNYGVNWSFLGAPYPESPGSGAYRLSISNDAQKIIATSGGGLYYTVDGGDTWVQQLTDLVYPFWSCCAMAKDGAAAIAGQLIEEDRGGRLWLYNGDSWAEGRPIDVNRHNWRTVAISDAGHVLFAGTYETGVPTLYSSVNYGASWNGEEVYADNPEPAWNAISIRATTRIVVASNGKPLFRSDVLPLPPVIRSFPWVGKFELSHVTA